MERKEIFNPMQGPDLSWKQIIAILNNQDPDIFTDQLRKIVSDKFGVNKASISLFNFKLIFLATRNGRIGRAWSVF